MSTELVFVLVRPAVPENVGAAARALKTMGFEHLRIVDSQAHQPKAARILAHGATDVLSGAQGFDELSSALADCDLRVATSAKERAGKRYVYSPGELKPMLESKPQLQRVAMVFGCEESGLSNKDLALCDIVTAIPLANAYPSLNLSQAVMLYAYELSSLSRAVSSEASVEAGQWQALKQRSEALLRSVDYQPGDKLWGWLQERLPLLNASDVGFAHLLLTRLQEKLETRND